MLEVLDQLDKKLLLFLNSHHHPVMDDVMWWISGKYTWLPFYFVLLALIIYYYRWKALPLILLIAVLITMSDFIASGILKPLVQRLRPSHDPEIKDLLHIVNGYRGGTYGFVSSHACNVFALAFYFYFTVNERIPWLKYVLFPWAVMVSYSRIYLGVHYPGDIIVPFILSFPIAFIVMKLYLLTERKYYKEEIIKC